MWLPVLPSSKGVVLHLQLLSFLESLWNLSRNFIFMLGLAVCPATQTFLTLHRVLTFVNQPCVDVNASESSSQHTFCSGVRLRVCWTCHSNMVVPCRDFPTACWKNVGGDIDANRFLFGDHVRSLSVQSHWSRSDFVRIFSDERFLNERFLGTCYLGDQRCLFPLWGFGVAVRMTRSNKLSLFEKDESLIA